jgi:hypothetical protein
MFKHYLRNLLLRTRGVHAYPAALAMVDKMTEAEAEGFYRLMQNIELDANADAKSQERKRRGW